VQDLARAIVLAGTKAAAAGQVFNITDGMTHAWRDLFHAIADAAGRSVRIIPVPLLLLKFTALPFELFSGVLSMRLDPAGYVEYFSRDLLFATAKAQSLLEWHPEYSLREGVKEMVAFYEGKRESTGKRAER
jgi:nucleoside-diphosphate-sugar epimerase